MPALLYQSLERIREICVNATQKRFSAWQGARGAGIAELHTDDVVALIDSHKRMETALRNLVKAGHALNSSSFEWNDVHAALDKAPQ